MSEKNKGSWNVAAEIRAEQKAALKDMPFKAKLEHYWIYYRAHALIAVISFTVIFSLLYNIITNKDYSFYALMLNSYGLSGEMIAEDFSAYADLNSDRYQCFIETSTYFNIDEFSPYEMATAQRIMATVIAGQLDVILSDGHTFIYFADGEFFVDLRSVLTEEELKGYEGKLFYIDQAEINKRNDETNFDNFMDIEVLTPEEQIMEVESHRYPENMANPIPVGIYMTDAEFFRDNGYHESVIPVFGIIGTSSRFETAMEYYDFLYYNGWQTEQK